MRDTSIESAKGAAGEPDASSQRRGLNLTQRVALSTGTQIGGALLGVLLSLAFLRISTSYLGSSRFGELAIVLALGGLVLTISSLGIGTTLAREIAKRPAEADNLGGDLLVARGAISAAGVIVVWLAIPLLPYGHVTKIALAISLLGVFFASVGTFPSAFFQANLHLQRQAGLDLAQKLLNLAALVTAVFLGLGLYSLVALLAVVNLTVCVASFRLARPFWRMNAAFRWRRARPLIRDSLAIGIVSTIGLLHYRGDAVLLSLLKPPADVGVYTIAYRFLDQSFLFPAFLMATVFPILTRRAHGDPAQRDALVNKLFQVLVVGAGVVGLAMFTLARPLVSLLAGPGFAHAAEPTRILSFSLLFIFASPVFFNLLIAVNRQSSLIVVGLVAIALNIGLNLVLIPSYSYNGAAAATVVSEGFAFAGTVVVSYRALRFRLDTWFVWCAAGTILAAAATVLALQHESPWLAFAAGETVFVTLALALRLVTRHDVAILLERRGQTQPDAHAVIADDAAGDFAAVRLKAARVGRRSWSFHRAFEFLCSPWLLAAIVTLGAGARIVRWANDRSLWGDEGALALNLIGKSASQLLHPLEYLQGAPVGFLLTERLDIRLFGPAELSLRVFPLVCGIGALAITAVIARKIFSPVAALIALVLVAASNPLVYYSSEVKQYSTDVLISVVLLWAAVAIDWSSLRPTRAVLVLVGGGVAVWFSHPALIVLPSLVAVLLVNALLTRNRRGLKTLAWLSCFWAASELTAYFVNHTNAARVAAAALGTTASGSRLGPLKDVWHSIPTSLGVANTATALTVVAATTGLVSLYRRNALHAALLAAPAVATFLAAVANRYPYTDRFVLFLVPSAVLLVAEGLWAITTSLWSRLPIAAVAAVVLVLIYPVATETKATLHPPGHEEVKSALRYVQAHWRPGDALYVWWQSQFPFRYYAECNACGVLKPTGPETVVWPPRLDQTPTDAALVTHPPDLYVGTLPHELSAYVASFDQLRGRRRAWFLFSSTWDDAFARYSLDCLGRRLAEVHATRAAAYLYDLSRPSAKSGCALNRG